MANNPLDDLIQTSSNQTTNPIKNVTPAVSNGPLQSQDLLNPIKSENVAPASSDPVSVSPDPLSSLLSGSDESKSLNTQEKPISSLNTSDISEQSDSPKPVTHLDSTAVSAPEQNVTNPLDSLMGSQVTDSNLDSVSITPPIEHEIPQATAPAIADQVSETPNILEHHINSELGTSTPQLSSPFDTTKSSTPSMSVTSDASKPFNSSSPQTNPSVSEINGVSAIKMNADTPAPSKKELEEKAKNFLKESPPKSKPSKKPLIIGLLTLLLVVGAAGGGLISYQLLNPDTNNETAAVSVGAGSCVIDVIGENAYNQPAGFGYKPASADVTDASRYYDVSKGEQLQFNATIKNKTNQAVSAVKRFYAVKVLESPVGTPVSANSPLDEATLITTHQQAPFDVQENPPRYKSPDEPFTLQPNESRTLFAAWRPTDNDCGLYQIDMNVEDTAGVDATCEPDFVAAAGFIRVVGCQEICGKTCSSDETCQSINSAYSCNRSNQDSDWTEVTQNVNSAGSGNLTCFNAFTNTTQADPFIKQHVVRDGKIWGRDDSEGAWKSWANETPVVNGATGAITGFSSYIKQDGVIQQHLVQGGVLWARNNQGDTWSSWENQTANVDSEGSGVITGFNAFLNKDGNTIQFLVRGNEVYRRDDIGGWGSWEKVTQQLSDLGAGNITCYAGQDKAGTEIQRMIRDGKLWEFNGDWFAGQCRLASNPSSQTCEPAPTPDALVCSQLSKSPAAPRLGDTVTFTCGSQPAAAKYEFRYSVSNGGFVPLAAESANPNTAKLTITNSGTHKIECRACEDASGTKCTTWGVAK